MTSNCVVCIPARRHSSRLPEKLLLAETGTPLLIHTCRAAARAFGQQAVLVATDDEALADCARRAGFNARLTSPSHQSGTDRIAEAVADLGVEIVINCQGDEPEIEPEHIRRVARLLEQKSWAGIATLATPGDVDDQFDPSAVKVVLGHDDRAITFSRAPLLWDRDADGPVQGCLRHLGLYAYRRAVLLGYGDLPHSRLEHLEKLEQLRAIEAGVGIACAVVDHAAPGIDTRADYDAFLARQIAPES